MKKSVIAKVGVKNEEAIIDRLLSALNQFCEKVIIIDDGSTDNTINIAAWNHAKKIKIIGNSNPKLTVKKSASDNKTQIVSSSN